MSVHGARFGRDCAMTSRVPSASPAASTRRKGSIDVHVGERIRQRRAVLDLSLDVVASRIGVSPQQLQKYEAADNRITAGRLFTCAIALDVPVSFFFDGLADGRDDSTTDPRATSSAPGRFMSATTTVAPRRASSSQSARPIPDAPPVMMVIRS